MGCGLVEQIGEDHHERPFLADVAEGQLVVAVHRGRLEIEERTDHRAGPAAVRANADAQARVERERTDAVTEHVGDGGDGDRGVDGGIESGAIAERRGHQPSRIDRAQHLALLLDAERVAHRPRHPCGRAPVDLTEVIVGQVLPDRLEVGAEPAWATRSQADLAHAPLAYRAGEAVGVRHVRIHVQLRGCADAARPTSETEGPGHARRERREHVPAASARDEHPSISTGALTAVEPDVGRERLPEAGASGGGPEHARVQRRADAARDDGRDAVARARESRGTPRRRRTSRRDGDHGEDRELPRHEQRGERTDAEQECRARRGDHGATVARERSAVRPRRRRRAGSARALPRAAARACGAARPAPSQRRRPA